MKNFETEELCQLVILTQIAHPNYPTYLRRLSEGAKGYLDDVCQKLLRGGYIEVAKETANPNYLSGGDYRRFRLKIAGKQLFGELSLRAYFPFWGPGCPGSLLDIFKKAVDELKQRLEKKEMETEKDWEALGRYTDAKERMKKYQHQRKRAAIELLGFLNNLIYENPENKIYRLNPLDANAVWDKVKEAEKHLMQAIDDMEKYAERANKSVPVRVENKEEVFEN